MDFGWAINALKAGLKVTRQGWKNGRFLWCKHATHVRPEWCHDPVLKSHRGRRYAAFDSDSGAWAGRQGTHDCHPSETSENGEANYPIYVNGDMQIIHHEATACHVTNPYDIAKSSIGGYGLNDSPVLH